MSTQKMNVLVTGANRGIGLEFTRQWLERGASVIATARDVENAHPLTELRRQHAERLRLLPLDVSDDASVQRLAGTLSGEPLHLLLNNAGVGGWGGLREFNTDEALRVFNTNALGPLRVTRALLPNLELGAPSKVVSLTSGLGSISDNTSGGSYHYRMSKAALNMASRNLALDLKARNIAVIVVNPGHVQTDMGGPAAKTPVEESVSSMMRIIDELTLEHTGSFYHFKGNIFPW